MTNVGNLLNTDPLTSARLLLGCNVIRIIGDKKIVAKIVEVEAYDQNDPASHSYRGPTKRNEVMFGKPGYAYVYFTYGMHYCLNIVSGELNYGSAVLIRALEPLKGIQLIRDNRHQSIKNDYQLTNGPAKLCQALDITKALNGHNLSKSPLYIEIKEPLEEKSIVRTTRIGIKKATNLKWRLYIKNNPYVSRY
jgi:DNA-3-methyladenine glycosylase